MRANVETPDVWVICGTPLNLRQPYCIIVEVFSMQAISNSLSSRKTAFPHVWVLTHTIKIDTQNAYEIYSKNRKIQLGKWL